MLHFRSSEARLSLSFAGVGTEADIRTREKMDVSEDSTACRRAAAPAAGWLVVLFAESELVDEVSGRFLRRKLPPEMKAAAEAGVGVSGVSVSADSRS